MFRRPDAGWPAPRANPDSADRAEVDELMAPMWLLLMTRQSALDRAVIANADCAFYSALRRLGQYYHLGFDG
jgi:hypothetical protein